uniref:Uncharacterized protein n=1 Tax=Nelumbo nucifera TaxID=4432 RepID=A0A822YS03_NELNU|nr:TPA_asm: hypothetical protein HUJ06_006072 [Nelumbo nucifera]
MTDGWIWACLKPCNKAPAISISLAEQELRPFCIVSAQSAMVCLGWLMPVPGVSNTVLELEAAVPYSRISAIQFLGTQGNDCAW